MGEVIYMMEWKRERLGRVPARTYLRRSRQDRREGSKPTATGSDMSAELRRLLLLE